MMHRQLIASSALVATVAAAAASATIWVTLTRPADAVALSNGDVLEFLSTVFGVLLEAFWRVLEYL